VPPGYSHELRALIDVLLKQSPRDRPSVGAVLRLKHVRGHLARYARHVDRWGGRRWGSGALLHGGSKAAPRAL
jgi:hypothetical protein